MVSAQIHGNAGFQRLQQHLLKLVLKYRLYVMKCSLFSQLQKMNLSKMSCDDINLQAIRDSDLTKQATEVVYTAVGFGVLAFQKIQVMRQEMATARKAHTNTAQ